MGIFDFFKKKNNNKKIDKLQEPLKIALSLLDKKMNDAKRNILIDLNFDQNMQDKFLIAALVKNGSYNAWGKEFISELLHIVDSDIVNIDEVNHLHKYISNELQKLEKMKD
jgi:hypothetical protein